MPSLRLLKLLPALLLALSLTAAAAEKNTPLKEFDDVRYEDNALVVTSNDISKRFILQKGMDDIKIGPRNRLRLPLNDYSVFVKEEEFKLSFFPLRDGRKGFKVIRDYFPRRGRRYVPAEEFTITIAPDGVLTFSETVKTR